MDFAYVEERVVVQGNTAEELMDSVNHYKKLQGMSVEEHLDEIRRQCDE